MESIAFFKGRFMAWHLKIAVLFSTLVTLTSTSKSCTITISYVLCNEVTINFLEAGKYPVNTTTVQAIHFNNNNLSHLSEDVFNAIPRLKFIVITHNLIETLDSGLFWNLKELKHLDLTDNKIKFLTSTIFISQTKLTNLLLSYNEIETLDARVFMPLDSLSNLDLTHNPFVCNCDLQDVVNWCRLRRLAVNTTCNDGALWSALNATNMCEMTYLYTTVVITSSKNLTTEIPSENLTKYETSRPFTIQEIMTVVGVIAVLVVCIVIGLYCWKRSGIFCFIESDRARNVGRTDIEDCRNEFVSSKRHDYLRESFSETASYQHDDIANLVSSPECVVLRRPSESDSIYLNPSKLTGKEDAIQELPDLAATYAEPFHRSDSPPPVYAVPFIKAEEKDFWIENDCYSTPKVDDKDVKYTKGKEKK